MGEQTKEMNIQVESDRLLRSGLSGLSEADREQLEGKFAALDHNIREESDIKNATALTEKESSAEVGAMIEQDVDEASTRLARVRRQFGNRQGQSTTQQQQGRVNERLQEQIVRQRIAYERQKGAKRRGLLRREEQLRARADAQAAKVKGINTKVGDIQENLNRCQAQQATPMDKTQVSFIVQKVNSFIDRLVALRKSGAKGVAHPSHLTLTVARFAEAQRSQQERLEKKKAQNKEVTSKRPTLKERINRLKNKMIIMKNNISNTVRSGLGFRNHAEAEIERMR